MIEKEIPPTAAKGRSSVSMFDALVDVAVAEPGVWVVDRGAKERVTTLSSATTNIRGVVAKRRDIVEVRLVDEDLYLRVTPREDA